MKIDELGFYLQASGSITKIIKIDEDDCEEDNCYTDMDRAFYEDGRYYHAGTSALDIIAHIPPALHYEILRVIEAYHQGGSFKSIIDNCYKNHIEKDRKDK